MASAGNRNVSSGFSSFAIMIGDEGAILIQMHRKRVIKRLFAQSPEPEYVRAFNEVLASAPHAPVTLLVDMMDQSYVRQTLPPVSSFNVGKIVNRRLDKDFSPDDIKGYVILGREKTGRKDWNYLMASLANPPLLQKWIAFAVERNNPFRGIGLIPLEVQPFLVATEKALLVDKGKDAQPLEWQILVSHHKVGGFRQIVLRGGKLAFTRMAQPIGESVPAIIAGSIEQEMINTLEYLKRMGLQDTATLSVVIVVSEDIKEVIDLKNIKAGEYHCFTPFEMASLLSLADAARPEDHFADVVIAAFTLKRRKLILPLQTPYIKRLRNISLILKGTWIAGAIAALAIFAWAGMSGYEVFATKQDVAVIQSEHNKLKAKLNELKVKAKILPKQIHLFSDVVSIVKSYNKRNYDPLVFVDKLAPALQNAGVVTDYHWILPDPIAIGRDSDKRQWNAEINLRLTSPLEPKDQYIANAELLMERIKKSFSGFDVSHSELPGLLSDSKELKTTIGVDNIASSPSADMQSNNVKVTIKGPSTPDPAFKNND